jgi:hypothetical protein
MIFDLSLDQMNRDVNNAKPGVSKQPFRMGCGVIYSHALSGEAPETGDFVAAPDARSWP